jgi:hypothetical protein
MLPMRWFESRELGLVSGLTDARQRPLAVAALEDKIVQRGDDGGAQRDLQSDGPAVEFARCFLRLANLPNFALDRLNRYEATLCRQLSRVLFALDALDRRKPQERRRASAMAAHPAWDD